ncbi:MAG: NifB/NifX family molybdenum-iron cluster-binding protein [Bacillota bacterium]|jgi:predicted Fe-Mo cluster-binding NifX family protein
MRICITSKGKELTDQLDERFGRCSYLLVVDTSSGAVESLKNPGVLVDHGAAIAAAQRVLDAQVDVLLTGNLGPNAEGMLESHNMTVYQARNCSVQEALAAYQAGQLKQLLSVRTGAEQ